MQEGIGAPRPLPGRVIAGVAALGVAIGLLVASGCATASDAALTVQGPNGLLVESIAVTEADRITSAYMVITAPAPGDRLVAASSPQALRVSIHGSSTTQAMVALDGLELPAGAPVDLTPGVGHLMLEGLAQPLGPGDRVRLDLVFEQAGTVSVDAPVVALVDVLDIYGGG